MPPQQEVGRRRRSAWKIVIAGGILAAVIAVTAGVTYALTRHAEGGTTAVSTTAETSPGDRESAKDSLCGIFETGARDQKGRGSVLGPDGMNVPLVVRTLNAVVAVQNALTPMVPEDVAEKARDYITTTLAMTTAAGAPNTTTAEINRLIDASNDATFALADRCGIAP